LRRDQQKPGFSGPIALVYMRQCMRHGCLSGNPFMLDMAIKAAFVTVAEPPFAF
jgi:hypothetical protein